MGTIKVNTFDKTVQYKVRLCDQACYDHNGLLAKISMDYIKNFEGICGTTHSNGVTTDFIKCMLFPFSVDDKASRWLKSLPTGSFTIWEQGRAAFLGHFYTKAKHICFEKQYLLF